MLFCTSIRMISPLEFSARMSTRLYLSYSSAWLLSLSSSFCMVMRSPSSVVSSPSSTPKFTLLRSRRFMAQSKRMYLFFVIRGSSFQLFSGSEDSENQRKKQAMRSEGRAALQTKQTNVCCDSDYAHLHYSRKEQGYFTAKMTSHRHKVLYPHEKHGYEVPVYVEHIHHLH